MAIPIPAEIDGRQLGDRRRIADVVQPRRLVERWFGELTTKKLQRGTHRSVRALNADIRNWINTWNDNPRPHVWTKTADQILDSIARYCTRINDSRH
jgi:class 3 adenylate cyclase